MAKYTKNGPNVTNTYGGYTVTWYCKQVAEITTTATTVEVVLNIYAHFVNSAHIYAGDINAALVVDNNVVNRANPQSDNWPSDGEDWHLISRKITYTRSTSAVTHTVSSYVQVTGGAWEGTSSTYSDKLTVNVPTLQSYTVSYDANGGSGAPASQTKYYGKDLILSSTRPTRSGYTFRGWGKTNSTTVVTYNPGGTYTSNSSAPLYAVWQKNSYTLTYNANEGSVSPQSKSVAYGAQYGSLPTPTKTGYDFLGWFTSASGGTQVSSTTTMGAANTTIYAHWSIAYTAPKLSIIESKRVGDNHDINDDAGTHAYVKFSWTPGSNAGATVTPTSYDISFTNQSSASDTFSITAQNISNSLIEFYSEDSSQTIVLNADASYIVKVVLHVSGQSDVIATNYISPAYFIMDVNAEGTAIGFGRSVDDGVDGIFTNMDIDLASGKHYKINGVSLDYITSQGTSGNWSYRKWNSGKVEVWLHETNATLAITSAVGSMYQSSPNITRTIPSAVTLTSVSYSNVDIKNANYSVWASTWNCSTTTIYFRAMSALQRTSASGYTIDAYIVGQGS